MSKTSSVYRNLKRVKMVAKYANIRSKLKAIADDKNAPEEERFQANLKLAALPRNSSKVRVRNRCRITGRSRSVSRKFGVSRVELRQMASFGEITGLVKSSWLGDDFMSMTDPLGDMLTRIRNAQRAKKSDVVSPASRLRENVLEVLKREGYIAGYEKANVRPGVDELRIQLKYHEGTSVITEIYRVSTPGRRVYSSVRDLPRVYNGLGISIVSTPKGVMSDNEARKANVGGEILCQVF